MSNFFKKIFTRGAADDTVSQSLAAALNFSRLSAGKGPMSLSAVNRAVNLIANSIAMLPVGVRDTSGSCTSDDLKTHPVSVYFNTHNNRSHISKYHLMRRMLSDVLLKGNAFAKINSEKGEFYSLRYLDDVTIQYNKVTDKLSYNSASLGILQPEQVVHLRLLTSDGINGESVRNWGQRAFNLADNAENLASKSFESGCNLAGILKVQGPLSEKQRKDILSSWAMAYTQGGSGLAVVPGNMDYQAIQQSSSAAQLLESRSYNVQDIARFFGINPVLLGDNTASSSLNLESILSQFVLLTLQPYIRMIEEEFSRKLLKQEEVSFEVNLDETYLLRADKTVQASYYSTLLQNGVLCINEVRKQMGLNEVEGLDKHIVAYTDINQNTINKEESNEVSTAE